ncbi:MAG TPA: BlaI/MecI/CopY family transcriptional regulator [Actinomycetota bacterium]|nr:BlaI/MecI/CopY family transcriptional regulator [Actinomycetota bacterium]
MPSRRKHSLSEVLGPLETEIMEVVWDLEEVTVRDVHNRLQANRAIAYTTVMTTLGRLSDKGLVKRVEEQPAHRYLPLVSREQYARSTVKSVVDWLIGHFPDPAVSYFVDRVEKEDERVMDRLKQMVDERRSTED